MSPLLVMDDICTEWEGLAGSPWCSSKNESSLASFFKKYQDKKAHHKKESKIQLALLTASPLGPIIPG